MSGNDRIIRRTREEIREDNERKRDRLLESIRYIEVIRFNYILNTHNLPTLINDSLTLSSTSGSGWAVTTATTATKCGPP